MKITSVERVTVTLPNDLVKNIDRWEKNRSRFVAEAVRNELDRRRRAQLRRSLDNPHPESLKFSDSGFDEWAKSLPEEDAESLVDARAGTPVVWIPGKGWREPSPTPARKRGPGKHPR
jgi:Arc/MetJ-type ribon-helix-helix transcriptional regulator